MADSGISGNKFFQQARQKASSIAGDKNKMNELVQASKEKLNNLSFEDSKMSKLAVHLRVIARMIRAYTNGSYRETPWKSLLAIIGALVYFIMPLDLIPDFIPFTGFLDDFTVVMLITGAFRQDIEDFLIWEAEEE